MPGQTATAIAESWDIAPDLTTRCDPLLDCLVQLTAMHGRPSSADALVAGLPLANDGMTPAMFVRAARRVGFSARVVRRPLDEISPLVLPAVLLLMDRGACVLTARDEGRRCRVLMPESGGEQSTTLDDVETRYAGIAILVQPLPKLDARSAHAAKPRSGHWFWSVMQQCWPTYGEALVAALLINLFALVTPFFSMQVYDRVVPNLVYETLWVLASGVVLVLLFDALMRTLRAYFIDVAGKRVDIALSANIFEAVLGIRMANRPASAGAFASNVQEFEAFRDFVTSATITTLVDLPFVLVFVAAMAWVGGPIAWIPVLAFPVVVGIGFALQPSLSAAVQESYRHASQRQATLVEAVVGLETVKAQRADGPLQARWEHAIGQLARLGLRSRFLSTAILNAATLVQQLAYVVVIALGVYLVGAERMTMGGLIACSLLTGRVLAPLSQLASLMTRFHQAKTALASIDRLMQLPVERPQGHQFVSRPAVRGAIEFADVCFRYPGQQALALDHVSFRVAPGERVALIGRVGSGKTTIERLVLGLYHPESGQVLIDGVESRQWDPAELRRGIGYVPQDIVLFYGSVRDNIVFGAPNADDAAVVHAAELAGVGDFVNRTADGFAMQVGERGEYLSGGQRQAIALARAYVTQPQLLVLDEPSNAMDNRSEELFKARLAQQLAGRTALLITHRASLLSLVDRVIVMDGGRLVADGPGDQVVAALAGGRVGAVASR
jgi:ATP-binding cassette subfamily C protein LapB